VKAIDAVVVPPADPGVAGHHDAATGRDVVDDDARDGRLVAARGRVEREAIADADAEEAGEVARDEHRIALLHGGQGGVRIALREHEVAAPRGCEGPGVERVDADTLAAELVLREAHALYPTDSGTGDSIQPVLEVDATTRSARTW
jgi:hypothetical protein